MPDPAVASGGIPVDLRSTGDIHDSPKVTGIANTDFKKVKTLKDLALSDITLEQFPSVKEWRNLLFKVGERTSDGGTAKGGGLPEICDELPRLLTEYMQLPQAQGLPPKVRRANALNYVFSHKEPMIHKKALLPGQTTTSFVGPVVHVDTIGYCIWPELHTVHERSQNPFNIRTDVKRRLNDWIFPYWMDRRTVLEAARYSDYDTDDFKDEKRDRVKGESIDPPLKKKAGETPKCQEIFERVAFFLSDKSTCVSHTVPDFERVLKYGLSGLSGRMKQDIADGLVKTSDEKEFAEGVMKVFDGAMIYAGKLADKAETMEKAELAAICRKVPAGPAKSFREAITSVWICYHLLLQENTNFGFSIGRLDQLLNPYYISEWEKLDTEEEKEAFVEKAVELVCHFFLRCSDHVPLSTEGSETLFAGSGSNQALTVGGTRVENGKVVDAVNDMTYIILKATELLSVRDPNVHARYHKEVHHRDADGNKLPENAVSPYLKRLCQVNIITRATPAIHGDAPVTQAMAEYYGAHEGISAEEAKADAYDYASIGCIEQNSNGKHYGNTGSTLLVLPSVLELTIYGGKHRSDGVGKDAPSLFYGTKDYTSTPLWNMKNMEEFIKAFRYQMNEMARHTVQNNNYLGRMMEEIRPVPFLSGLFTGPTNTPDSDDATYRDLSAGGAKYNSSGVAVIGIADVIDSFCVIKSLVFGNKVSAAELLSALDADFVEGGSEVENIAECLRGLVTNDREGSEKRLSEGRMKEIVKEIAMAPKYGAGVDPGNMLSVEYTNEITGIVQETYRRYRTHRGGRYLPGYWSMTNHAGFGMLSKAMPNGRKKGMAFASGITPCPKIFKSNGDPVMVVDHISSVASVDADTVQNGYTYNLSLTTQGAEHFDADTNRMGNYMKAFEDRDGVLVQLCITPIEEFEEAHELATKAETTGLEDGDKDEFDKYRDLMIRVAGYSAYFVTLSKEMRQEIIDRSNFALKNGEETHVY